MRIVHLTAGTGSFHCGTCLRDHALVKALRRQGHEAVMVPLYLPLVLDGGDDAPASPIFFGGVSVYLQQRSPLFGRTPAWLDRLLNAPPLLRGLSRLAGMTRASELGDMTVSMLRGEAGRQASELDKLARWLETGGGHGGARPEVVALSNLLLVGVAGELRRRLGVPVVCSMQGEDAFLDSLPSPQRERAWALLAERAADVSAFVAPSEYYRGAVAPRLGLPAGRIEVIHNGVEPADFARPPGADRSERQDAAPADPPVLGYLARMSAAKGLGTLVEAFIHLKKRAPSASEAFGPDRLRLRIAGAMTAGDKRYVDGLRLRLRAERLDGEAEFLPNLDRDAKLAFLRSLTILSVPATYGEAFGLYVLEAWASGVPVVVPRHGAFPELLALGGGGSLCEPDDPASLADAVARMLGDPAEARATGRRGRDAVVKHFNADRMARQFAGVCQRALGANRPTEGASRDRAHRPSPASAP